MPALAWKTELIRNLDFLLDILYLKFEWVDKGWFAFIMGNLYPTLHGVMIQADIHYGLITVPVTFDALIARRISVWTGTVTMNDSSSFWNIITTNIWVWNEMETQQRRNNTN